MELPRVTVALVTKVSNVPVALTGTSALHLPLAVQTATAMATSITQPLSHVTQPQGCVWLVLTMPQGQNVNNVPVVSMVMPPDNLVNHANVTWVEPEVSHVIKSQDSVIVCH